MITLQSENVNKYKYKNECDCEYACDDCSVEFVCDVTNKTDDVLCVTNRDLISSNPEIVCSGATATIVKLGRGESLKFKGIACKHRGNEHAKFSPVTIVRCVYNVDKDAPVQVRHVQSTDPREFEFEIETTSAMKAKTALNLALDFMIKKISQFSDSLDLIA